jgi:hypothetical protein
MTAAHAGRTSYARAVAGFDDDYERALVEAITRAIAEASMVTDANIMVIRTGEAASALVTALASVLALSPAATRSPSAIRKTIDNLGKRLRRRVAAAESNADMQDFIRRAFRGTDVGGRT